MKTQRIGQTDLVSTVLVYGVMRVLSPTEPAQTDGDLRKVGCERILSAVDAGYNHFDSADIYCGGLGDEVLGEAIRSRPGLREQVIVTTKCSIRWLEPPVLGSGEWFDMSEAYITESCEKSLKRLKMDTIDIFLIHRPDVLFEADQVAGAFDRLRTQGKVRYFGVSNFFPHQVSLLQSCLSVKLAMNQVPIDPLYVDRMYDGTLEQCRQMSITPQSYSPLARGTLGTNGALPEDQPQREKAEQVVAVFDQVAEECGVTRTQITLAWLLRHPAGILPVIGTTRADRMRESAEAAKIELSRPHWHRLTSACRWLAGFHPFTGAKE